MLLQILLSSCAAIRQDLSRDGLSDSSQANAEIQETSSGTVRIKAESLTGGFKSCFLTKITVMNTTVKTIYTVRLPIGHRFNRHGHP
jgi:hypothetical protein